MIDAAKARLLDAIRRQSFSAFARAAFVVANPGETLEWNWHLDAICHALEEVRQGRTRRLIIEVPPRSLKSFLASIALPAFWLGGDPGAKIITASYSLDLASKHMNDFRALVRSPWYRALFPHMAGTRTKDTETDFTTAYGGCRYATSNGATLTGRGGDVIILDDPMRADDAMSLAKRQALQEWYRNTLYSRLDSKLRGAIVLVMQRLHIDDLSGYLRAQGGWKILSLPAIAPEPATIVIGPRSRHVRAAGDLLQPAREPAATLDDIKHNIGGYNFSAQYQQEPVPVEGQLVKWSWFRMFDKVPERRYRIVQSWDVASKDQDNHDYSVCTTWAIMGEDCYLLNVLRQRYLFPQLFETVIAHARRLRAETLLIEDKHTGIALIQQLKEKVRPGVPSPTAITPKLDKLTRMSAESIAIEQGRVHLQAGAPWLAEFRSEFLQFPNGRHDDQVDSTSQLLGWVRERRSPDIGFVRIR